MSAPATIHHAHFSPPFSTVTSEPVVEFLRIYCPADVDTAHAEKEWAAFAKEVDGSAEGYIGQSCGWIVEDLEYENIDGKAKGLTAGIAWTSVEAHLNYRETQHFKDNIGRIRKLGKGSIVVSLSTDELLERLLI
jgi:hypothetical protein